MAPIIAAFLGFAAALVVGRLGGAALMLVLGGLAASAALLVATLRPALFLLGLLLVVVLQDALVGAGLGFLQPADEAMLLLGVIGIAIRAAGTNPNVDRSAAPDAAPHLDADGQVWRRSPLDLPTLGFCLVGALAAIQKSVPLAVAGLGMLAYLKGMLAFQLTARLPFVVGERGRARRNGRDRFDVRVDRHDRARSDARSDRHDRTPRAGDLDGAHGERRPAELQPASGLRPALAFLAGLAAFMALVALAQRLGGEAVFAATGHLDDYQKWAGGKSPSLFYNHNAFGHVVVFGGALALGQALFASAPGARKLWGLAAFVSGIGLLLSASRESWLGAAAGLILAAGVQRSRRLTGLVAAIVTTLAIGGAVVYMSSETMQAELARRTAGVTEGWHDYQLGFTGWKYRGEYRVYVILKSLEVFVDQPLLGTGPGRFGGHVATRYPTPVYEQYGFLPLDGAFIPLDVFWSRLLTEMGLLGSFFYLWALGAALLAFWSAARSPDAMTRGLGLGGVVAWGAVLVFGVFAPALEDPLTAIPFWAWAGLAWRLGRAGSSRSPEFEAEDARRIEGGDADGVAAPRDRDGGEAE